MIATMPADVADWIYWQVFSATYRNSCTVTDDDPRPIRYCVCQGGQCGHCQAGRHTQCRTRIHGPLIDGTVAYLVGRRGGVVAQVLPTGRPCRWVCSCDCRTAAPVDPEQPTVMAPELVFEQMNLFELAGGAR